MLRTKLNSIPITCGTKTQLLSKLHSWNDERASACACSNQAINSNRIIGFINPHVFNLSYQHKCIQEFLEQADLTCVDGLGVKLALLFTKFQIVPRVVAEHLFSDFLLTLNKPVKVILIGGEPGIADRAAKKMSQINQHLIVCSSLNGYQSTEINREYLKRYKHIPLVLIGAGSPLSESLALHANQICHSAVIFHIGGGTLNTYAGSKKRCPRWLSKLGFEWLHRILFEPHTRSRYLSGGNVFIKHLYEFKCSVADKQGNSL